jgi:hypothetical protein
VVFLVLLVVLLHALIDVGSFLFNDPKSNPGLLDPVVNLLLLIGIDCAEQKLDNPVTNRIP